ncbi:hypothetical protein AAAU22_12075 [[Clostridium] symbiosum]
MMGMNFQTGSKPLLHFSD